ncbi:hypothetical protein, partial [Achromobacter sp. AGC25]
HARIFINAIGIIRKTCVSTVYKCDFEQRINDFSYKRQAQILVECQGITKADLRFLQRIHGLAAMIRHD